MNLINNFLLTLTIFYLFQGEVISSNTNTITTSASESNSTSSNNASITLHEEITAPLIPNEEFGGFDLKTYTFSSNFSCMNLTNPTTADDCLNLTMAEKDYSCCFVTSIVKGLTVNNTCIPMNASNLPAFKFLIYNNTAEIESFYNCYSVFNVYSSIVSFFIILIIINI
jgi:hypothetical protein